MRPHRDASVTPMAKSKKRSGPEPKRSKVDGGPKSAQQKLLGKRITSERPQAPRDTSKGRGR